MRHNALLFLLLGLLVDSPVGANTLPGQGGAAAVDANRDARLGARVRLRAAAIPLRRVLRALADGSGVRLDVAGTAGDERLVAFVPDASLADVMLAVADLYRLTWIRSGNAGRLSYQLLKLPAMAREEQALRERSYRGLLVRLEEELQSRQRPREGTPEKRPDTWAPIYPLVLPMVMAHSTDLLRDGYVYLPIAGLPAEQRQPLVRALQPLVDAQHVAMQQLARESRERMRAEGGPNIKISIEDRPPPPADLCIVTMELAVRDEPTASVGLKTGAGSSSGWFIVTGEGLQAAAMELYKDRHPHLPAAADAATEPGSDPLERVADIPAEQPPKQPGDWIGELGRLSDAAGVAIYADSYPNYLEGITWHPRSDFVVSGKLSVAHALNRLCYPIANRGAQKLEVNSFWWRRGDAALLRSRRWLWESAALLPSALLDHLTASLRATGQLDPRDLPRIAALSTAQVQSVGFLDRGWETWRRAVQVPAQLSLEARKRLLTTGLTWETMTSADRALVARLLPLPPGGTLAGYAARLKSSVNSMPAQGGTVVSVEFEANHEAGTEQSYIYLPLPGVSGAPGLPPMGLLVSVGGQDQVRPGATPSRGTALPP